MQIGGLKQTLKNRTLSKTVKKKSKKKNGFTENMSANERGIFNDLLHFFFFCECAKFTT